jgi:hypothetical protein
MKTMLFLSLACLMTYGTAFAADRMMECTFPEQKSGGGGWTGGPVVFFIADGASVATVNSGAITYFAGEPIEARVVRDVPGHIALSWEINMKDNANQYSRMGYRLSVREGGAAATISAQPLSYENIWRNAGTCKKLKS